MAHAFTEYQPRTEDYWRSIIMFGRNVASYKFALGRALLEISPEAGRLVTLEELAAPFAAHLCTHLRTADKQGTFRQSRFLEACRKANAGEIEQQELVATTVRLGFNNVIDAFHVVGREDIACRFFLDERRPAGGIRVTDEFASLLQSPQASNLPDEAESRWRLVESAWELGVSRALVGVEGEGDSPILVGMTGSRRRKPITGAREALSGYQKGHCFYCFAGFTLNGKDVPDVDHFFPHSLVNAGFGPVLNGVWNLVLACRACNRGVGGKSNLIPTLALLERLSTRNEFLIASHHPLRETLLSQLGPTEAHRRAYLNDFHRQARAALIHTWEPPAVMERLY